jgi:hypothetical protein
MQEAIVPKGVLLIDPITQAPADDPQTFFFNRYAVVHWLNDKRWNDLDKLEMRARIKKEVLKPEGSMMTFEEEDLKVLGEIIRKPTVEREPPLIYEQVAHFDKLILDLLAKPAKPVAVTK